MTSIEWLIEQIESSKITSYMDGNRKKLICLTKENLIEQAKEMHKAEIMKSFEYGVTEGTLTNINYLNCNEESEFYYNETYKKD